MLKEYKQLVRSIRIALGKRLERKKLTAPPIIIGGCGRSGTTVLLSILSAHNEIIAHPKEVNIFGSRPTRIDRMYRFLLSQKIPKTAKRWCEKTPLNIRHIEFIDDYFKGNFRLIHIIRDGRDVILSKHPTNSNEYWVSPERWIEDVSIGLKFINHPKVHTIKYENLIHEYEKTIGGICAFLNMPLSEEILNWHKNASVTENRAYFTKVQELSAKSIGKWKDPKYQDRVVQLTEIPEGKKLLKELGYY